MQTIRRSNERGNADHGWLKSKHSFSFADYHDPAHMGFRSLRVINEDHIAGGMGFGAHPHRDMEIITYVIKGALAHEDSMGNKAVILPGEVQRMTAGIGVVHAEQNNSKTEEVHLFQIWIMPKVRGGTPGYGQKSFEADLNSKKSVLVVSQEGRDGSIAIKQDAEIYISRLKAKDELDFKLRPTRGAWIQILKGEIELGADRLKAGDAVAITEQDAFKLKAFTDSEIMLFDLA